MQLIIDSREGLVSQHSNILDDVAYTIKQITIGDYAVINEDGSIAAIIERKTLVDFAASIKDGRAENKTKLLELEGISGCAVFYIIEGTIYPRPGLIVDGLSYEVIESAIIHLMVRDKISVLWSESSKDTAALLVRIVRSIGRLNKKIGAGDTSMLHKKHERTADDIVVTAWASIKYVGPNNARMLASKWTLTDLLTKNITETELRGITGANGRKLQTKTITQILGDNSMNVLCALPHVSKHVAMALASANIGDKNSIANTLVGARRFGDVRANKLFGLLNHKLF